jgi:hypothetical protein
MQHPLAVVFERLGPYHHVRLSGAAKKGPVLGVQVVSRDSTYAWDTINASNGFRWLTLFPENSAMPSTYALAKEMYRQLDREKPAAVAVPGWSAPEALSALAWATDHDVPAVLMSDSQARDQARSDVKEACKRQLVALCSAALVAGSRHRQYVAALGLPSDRIFTGYDVVDNEYFARGAEDVRRESAARSRLRLPEHFFLAPCRFIPEKNLPGLLAGYARYRTAATEAWNLVLLGDGPLREQVRSTIHELRLEDSVLLPGFKQYEELPAYFGLADAFVLPSVSETWGLVVNEAMAAGLPVIVSIRCGCAPDLVEEGKNGWTFDPTSVDSLAELMLRISRLTPEERLAMGRASEEIIARWTPDTFAEGLWRAVEAAKAAPRPHPTLLDKALLRFLIHRRV